MSTSRSNVIEIGGEVEVRKLKSLSPSHLAKLTQLLDENDSWRVLMSFIPKELPSSGNVLASRTKLYNSAHIKLIENAAKKDPRSPAEIFLFEWSLTGRRRPTVVHLLELLKSASMYRAADYVSMEILRRGAVERPSTGPAAKIKVCELDSDEEDNAGGCHVSDVTIENNLDNSKPENTLCAANAPKLLVPPPRTKRGASPTTIGRNISSFDRSTARIGENARNLPEVQIIEATTSLKLDDALSRSQGECRVENIVLQSPPDSETRLSSPRPEISDLMQFSQLASSRETLLSSESTASSEIISSKVLSANAGGPEDVLCGDNRPNFSALLQRNAVQRAESVEIDRTVSKTNADRPHLSALLDIGGAAPSGEQISERPDLSGLLASHSGEATNSGESSEAVSSKALGAPSLLSEIGANQSSGVLPAFSALLGNVATVKDTNESSSEATSSDDD